MIKADSCSCSNEKHCLRSGSVLSANENLDNAALENGAYLMVQATGADKGYRVLNRTL
jgi:hypothetical protein